jgi:hypothetical protein
LGGIKLKLDIYEELKVFKIFSPFHNKLAQQQVYRLWTFCNLLGKYK